MKSLRSITLSTFFPKTLIPYLSNSCKISPRFYPSLSLPQVWLLRKGKRNERNLHPEFSFLFILVFFFFPLNTQTTVIFQIHRQQKLQNPRNRFASTLILYDLFNAVPNRFALSSPSPISFHCFSVRAVPE